MIKVSNAYILIAEEAISKFISVPLPIDVSFRIKKILEVYNQKLIEAKTARLELFKKYGEETSDGINIKDENKEKFDAEIQELVEKEVTLNVEPCTTKSEWLPRKLVLSPEELAILQPFIILE